MLIHVVRTDKHYDYVKDFMLESLIESNEIIKFKRSSGWVIIGVDPIRGCNASRLAIDPDRRSVKRHLAQVNNNHAPLHHVSVLSRRPAATV